MKNSCNALKSIYVVYQHVNEIDNQPFYIGIGNIKRPYNFKRRNYLWKDHILKNPKFKIEILFQKLTWHECCKIEKQLINKYGRIDLKTGILCNLTDGGEGTIGRSEEWKLNHSNKISGENNGMFGTNRLGNQNPFYGKQHNKEVIEFLRENSRIKRTGKKYYTIKTHLFDINKELIKSFKSIGRCMKFLNLSNNRHFYDKVQKSIFCHQENYIVIDKFINEFLN